MLLNRTISCCKILQLKLFFSTLSNFKSKMTITLTLTFTVSFTLMNISNVKFYVEVLENSTKLYRVF